MSSRGNTEPVEAPGFSPATKRALRGASAPGLKARARFEFSAGLKACASTSLILQNNLAHLLQKKIARGSDTARSLSGGQLLVFVSVIQLYEYPL
jgi:hypothetical protein